MRTIRLATPADAPGVLDIYGPVVRDTAISFAMNPPSLRETEEWIERVLESHAWMVCEEAGRILGYAYGTAHRARDAYAWSTEVSVYVGAWARRQGVARGLYGELLPLLARMGFAQAYAGIALPNPGSVAIHEKAGFTPIGVFREIGYKMGRWHDVGWWQRPLRHWEGEPERPKPLGHLESGPPLGGPTV